jgi:putative peptidoglycan lipid II flippase
VAAGFSSEKAELCATLVRIMMPFLPTISLAAVAMGALNGERKYTAPALASSMFNLVAIVGGTAIYAAGVSSRMAAITWGVLTLVGGVAQVATQGPTLLRAGFRPRFMPDLRLRDEGTRRVAMMIAPAALGVAAVQVNVVVNTTFASLISDGAISWLSYAFRLMQLPIGVFGVAVGTTALTELSADASKGDMRALQANLRRGLRLVLFLTIPSTVGLALLGVPIIRVIFQHGKFSADATLQTAHALSGYAVGLVAYAAIKVLAMPFYALKRVRVPVIASLTAVAANLVWNVATYRTFGHVGLALGTSIAALANFIVLAVAFQTQIKGLLTRDLLLPLLRILVASAAMGAAVWFVSRAIESRTAGVTSTAVFAFQAFVPILVGVAVYFAAARLLGIEEARLLTRRRR